MFTPKPCIALFWEQKWSDALWIKNTLYFLLFARALAAIALKHGSQAVQ